MSQLVITPKVKVIRPFATSIDWLSKVAVSRLYGDSFANWFFDRFNLLDTDAVGVNTVVEAHDIYVKYVENN